MGVMEIPGASAFTMNKDNAARPCASTSSPRATTMMESDSSTAEVQYLLPLNFQPVPSRLAMVLTLCVLVPALGSVMAKANRLDPSAKPGSHSFFMASLPCCSMMGAQIEPMTSDKMGQPCAAVSSTTTL